MPGGALFTSLGRRNLSRRRMDSFLFVELGLMDAYGIVNLKICAER
jgi:hypothetical protein